MTRVVTEDAGALAIREFIRMVPVVVCVSMNGGLGHKNYGVVGYVELILAAAAATAHPDPKDKNCLGERGWTRGFSAQAGVHSLL